MQSRTGLWNPFQQGAAKAKNSARASEDLDVYMKNMSIQSKIFPSLKGKAFGSTYSFAGSFQGPSRLQMLVSGSSASGVADAFGIPSHWWQSQAQLLLLRVSGSPRVIIPSQGLTWHWIYCLSFFTWWHSKKQQISVGKISQLPREVNSPTFRFQGAQATTILLSVYIESNWPFIYFAMYFPLGYPLTCLFCFLTGRFFLSICWAFPLCSVYAVFL